MQMAVTVHMAICAWLITRSSKQYDEGILFEETAFPSARAHAHKKLFLWCEMENKLTKYSYFGPI